MIEVYSVPSCVPVSATYTKYVSDTAQSPVTLSNVVFFEKKGMLESGMVGITYNVQISQTELATKPGLQDYITINSIKYKFINPQLKNQSPLLKAFWQSEVKSVK
jgi:hypothetical protein